MPSPGCQPKRRKQRNGDAGVFASAFLVMKRIGLRAFRALPQEGGNGGWLSIPVPIWPLLLVLSTVRVLGAEPTVTIAAPVGTQVFYGGQKIQISFSSDTPFHAASFWLSTDDGGTNWGQLREPVIEDVGANTPVGLEVELPKVTSSRCRFKVVVTNQDRTQIWSSNWGPKFTIAPKTKASLTIITHGYQFDGSFPDWPRVMGHEIIRRAGGGAMLLLDFDSGSATMIDPATGNPTGAASVPIGTGATVIIFNWAAKSNETDYSLKGFSRFRSGKDSGRGGRLGG